MQQFKKIVLSALLGGMLSSNANAQKELIISGGNNVSSFVCLNKKAYTWGNNTNTLGTGLLANGSSAVIVNTPTAVTFPANIGIQQISSGSGSHFLALDCNGGMWAWGNNQYGQIGNNTLGNNVIAPSRVKLGILSTEATTFDPTNTGFITQGVKVVYAASQNSFAILEDGRLISWGANNTVGTDSYFDASGQLGDGTITTKTTPVFVKSGVSDGIQGNGQPLKNVTQVSATDNVAYALVDNQYGDGTSTVFSWGNGRNGTLGRNPSGYSNPSSSATILDPYARPVCFANGLRMDYIVSISAGDVYGMALDLDGYVWTWGNGSWNNATGNTTINYTGSDPRRVIKGTTAGASNDGTYLLAKSIGGGQGYGMAVTIDGKPVAWGGNTLDCTSGGITGTGATQSAIPPSYIKNGTGTSVHDDVLAVFRGDTWGYYQRSDGSIYTWGCNNYGQLGIGNTLNQATAVLFTPPTGCSLPDPKPVVNLTPSYPTVCASKLIASPVILNSGFVISASLASNYIVTWKREDFNQVVKTGTATAANLTYSAINTGKYSVTIKYVGLNVGCTPYVDATASTIISAYPKNFTTPSNLTYCGSTSSINVNSTATDNPVYKFYPTPTSTTVLGTTVSSGSTTIDLTTATNSGTDKIVYVEQASQKSGTVLKKNQACDTTFNSFYNIPGNALYQSGFTTTEDNVTLSTLNIRLRSTIYTSSTYSAILNFGIYGSKTGIDGQLIADPNYRLYTFNYNFSRIRSNSDPQVSTSDYLVTVNTKLPKAGTYFISLLQNQSSQLTAVSGSGYLEIGRGSCAQTVPLDGTPFGIIRYTHNSLDFQNAYSGTSLGSGHFFNVGFAISQGYCDRLPITLTEKCITTKLEETAELNNTIRISPSPFKDQFTLETSGMEKVLVHDQRGVLIEEKSLVNLKNIQLGQTWSSGLYMLQLVGNGTVKTVKVIKEQ